MLRPLLAVGAAAAATFAVGCGEKKETLGSTGTATPSAQTDRDTTETDEIITTTPTKPSSGAPVRISESQFGRVVADRKGEALYLFDKESGPKAECYGECAKAWPPFLTKGKPRAIK